MNGLVGYSDLWSAVAIMYLVVSLMFVVSFILSQVLGLVITKPLLVLTVGSVLDCGSHHRAKWAL